MCKPFSNADTDGVSEFLPMLTVQAPHDEHRNHQHIIRFIINMSRNDLETAGSCCQHPATRWLAITCIVATRCLHSPSHDQLPKKS